MDFGKQLEALNLTRDEMKRLSDALKDSKFRELLTEYAAEISDPDSRRQYEEDIRRLEEDRGVDAQFIHPEAHHVLQTRRAELKCFINVCGSPLVARASCEAARDRTGAAGHNWTLPFSLTPERPDRDAEGNPCVIYDVVFHPDTLHMAGKNERFLKLIDSTAVRGIEDSFQVKLDNSNIKTLKTKYKGFPHPAVIRKPIPGYMKQKQSSAEERLMFPYPDEIISPEASAAPNPPCPDTTISLLSKEPTKPHYTVKYRTVVDLQNYRFSRDSAPSPRPKDIIIIIDLPLIRSARDVDVNVTERRLILETHKPSYKLELPLSFPVDEDKGDAKFNRTTRQLTLTLPVSPVKNTDIPQMRCDDDEEETERESDSKAGLTSQEEQEEQRETQDRELNCDILTQSVSDRCELISESLCLPNNCATRDSEFLNLMKQPQTNDTSNKISPTDQSKTEPEVSEFKSDTCVVPGALYGHDKEFVEAHYTSEREQKSTSEQPMSDPTAAMTSPDVNLIYQQFSSSPNELNPFPTEALNSSDGTGQECQKPNTRRFSEEPNSASNHETDMTVNLTEETGVQSKKPADVDNTSSSHLAILRETNPDGREAIICDHMTSAALCFQNSLWFDLD